MFLKLTPDLYYKNFYDIKPEAIKSLGGKAVFVDLDGTLVSKDTKIPTTEVTNWINEIKSSGIEILILSNNCELRVRNFSKELGIKYFFKALKPSTKGFKRAFFGINSKFAKNEVVMIGDQIYTDTLGARLFGAKSIYVEPIDSDDLYVKFRTNITEKPFLKKFKEII